MKFDSSEVYTYCKIDLSLQPPPLSDCFNRFSCSFSFFHFYFKKEFLYKLFSLPDNSCNETYIKTSNASSQGGIEQPKDINTFARCASRCIDYAIATDHTCHGFDLNTTTDLCTIYLEADFKLWPSDQVDNYRRNKTCELPYY